MNIRMNMKTRTTIVFFICLMIGLIFPQRPITVDQNDENYQLRTEPNWSVNPPDFLFSGSVTASVSIFGNVVGSASDMVAAFVNGDVRGVAYGLYFPPTNQYVFMILIYSNNPSGETITFKYYNAASDIVYEIEESIPFVGDMMIGNPMEPHPFNLEVPSLEISSITIENINDISLGNHVYENQTANINVYIYNPGSSISNQLVIGLIYNWFFATPPSTEVVYDFIQSIPPINPLSTITIIIPTEFSVIEDSYGKKPISARIDPNGVGGDFYSWFDEDKFIGWVQNSVIDGYDWPVPAGNMEKITSVPNEFRGSNGPRIHQGIDLSALGGSNILSVSSGKIIDVNISLGGYSNYVTFENYDINSGTGFRFYHLTEAPIQPLAIDEWVYSTGEIIANVYSGVGPHIHMEDFTKFGIDIVGGPQHNYSVNPLRVDGLDGPWIDNPDQNSPIIDSDLLVLTNGTNPLIVQGNVFGYEEAVDFVISAKDIGPSGSRMGLARISFRILDLSGLQVFPDPTLNVWETRVELHTTLDDANYYQMMSPNATPYIYCYTECNDPGGDPYVDGSAPNESDQYVRYFITNNITNPQSGSFSGYFKASEHGMTFNNYELIVRVEDYSGNPATESFLLPINENGIIPGEK